MTTDRTQHQSSDEEQHARELSLKSARPPVDLPNFDAQRLLGRGAYGEVWVGVDLKTGRPAAIKFFTHRRGVDWTSLSREVEKLVYLSADRYVVQLLDVGWDSDPPYYVMEYIENGSLEDLLRRAGPLSVGEAVEIFTDVSIGLLHAHGKGVLHCDLKPANILLDQDHRPRLADFGQSRLSHEQSPSLGTLFYMAPEQADLKAMPDARWDVYALGAILYCMLTGEPPFRQPGTSQGLDANDDLITRLHRYQRLIRTSPTPTEHRRVPRIDRALTEIVDRCLAVDPERRFANVQAVIDALDERAEARLRRPLMFLGFVGPILLFVIMMLFGLRGYDEAMRESETFVTLRAKESNDFAAKFAASSIEGEIRRYFRVASTEASSDGLHQLLAPLIESDILKTLNDSSHTAASIQRLRPEFLADPQRQRLEDYLQQRVDDYHQRLREDPRELKLASLFIVDQNGRHLAGAYDSRQTVNRSTGWNYSYRTYFHGGPADLCDSHLDWQNQLESHAVEPITSTHFSAAFQSTTTDIWKVAVSTPIFQDNNPQGAILGVLSLTLNLGDFAYLRTNHRPDHFAVLIDGRPGPNYGVILQHPLFDRLEQINTTSDTHFRIDEEQLRLIESDANYRYQDPVAATPEGAAYRGDWIPAAEWVRLPEVPEDPDDLLTGNQIIVLVQEKYALATAPVRNLGSQLKREGSWALVGVVAVVLVLWYVVIRVLSDPHHPQRRGSLNGSQATSVPNLSTLPAPHRRPPTD